MKRRVLVFSMFAIFIILVRYFVTHNVCEMPANTGELTHIKKCTCNGYSIKIHDSRQIDGSLITACLGALDSYEEPVQEISKINSIRVTSSGGYSAYEKAITELQSNGSIIKYLTNHQGETKIIKNEIPLDKAKVVFDYLEKINLNNYEEYYGCPINSEGMCPMVDLPEVEILITKDSYSKNIKTIQLPFAPPELRELIQSVYAATNQQ